MIFRNNLKENPCKNSIRKCFVQNSWVLFHDQGMIWSLKSIFTKPWFWSLRAWFLRNAWMEFPEILIFKAKFHKNVIFIIAWMISKKCSDKNSMKFWFMKVNFPKTVILVLTRMISKKWIEFHEILTQGTNFTDSQHDLLLCFSTQTFKNHGYFYFKKNSTSGFFNHYIFCSIGKHISNLYSRDVQLWHAGSQ